MEEYKMKIVYANSVLLPRTIWWISRYKVLFAFFFPFAGILGTYPPRMGGATVFNKLAYPCHRKWWQNIQIDMGYGCRWRWDSCRRCPLASEASTWLKDSTIPHTTVNRPFCQKSCWSCMRCAWGSGGICITWAPKKWVERPFGLAMICHMNMSHPFIEGLFLLQEVPFGFKGCLWDLGQPKMGFAMISHTIVNRSFIKKRFSSAGDALSIQGGLQKTFESN